MVNQVCLIAILHTLAFFHGLVTNSVKERAMLPFRLHLKLNVHPEVLSTLWFVIIT